MIIAKLPWWAKRLMARFGNLSLEQLNPLAPLQTLPQSPPQQAKKRKMLFVVAEELRHSLVWVLKMRVISINQFKLMI